MLFIQAFKNENMVTGCIRNRWKNVVQLTKSMVFLLVTFTVKETLVRADKLVSHETSIIGFC